jgi:Asp-tRNA(Asn)/Glu-tRNA(Gln) amidotransferase A subunit family amidase
MLNSTPHCKDYQQTRLRVTPRLNYTSAMQCASEIAVAVTSGALSPVDAVRAAQARIEAVEAAIHAWVEIDGEGALRQANDLKARLSRGEAVGPLAGVAVGIKDIVDVAGLPTRLGAKPFAHSTPERDATVVARLRAAGAVILGKTHTTEFAYLDPAPTRNPWRRNHTPGGSSSGSAAAVGAGTIPLAIGSQTVGSVLRPAAYCGSVGLKPTYGLISYAGTAALAVSFDHIGVLAHCVADAALALGCLVGRDRLDANSIEAPGHDYVAAASMRAAAPRLGLIRSYYQALAMDVVNRHLDLVAERLEDAGAEVLEAEMPGDAAAIREAGDAILKYEAAQTHARRFEAHADEYRPGIRVLVEAGRAISDADYTAARTGMARLRDGMLQTLSGFDALLLPTAPATAPASIETTGPGVFCAPASFAGLPAISLPTGLAEDGLPLAVQLVAAPLAEPTLLRTAAWVERIVCFVETPDIAT